MSRSPVLVAGIVWLVALAGAIVAGLIGGWHLTVHGYVAGWLIAISLPLGALPILMTLDLFGVVRTPSIVSLRLLVAGLPVLAILVIPILVDLRGVFPWPAGSTIVPASTEPLKGFARGWYSPGFFAARSVIYLLVWSGLAMFFLRPAPRQPAVAGVGLALHAVIGTLAAYDWWMSLDQAFNSSAYGVLVISAQCAFALTVALGLGVVRREDVGLERPVLFALLAVTLAAAFVQFGQFLVIWSANLPREIVWYQTRWVGALGPVFVIGAPLLLAIACILLALAAYVAHRIATAVALAALFLLGFLDLACLASPRGSFTFPVLALDLAFLILVGGLAALCAAALGERRSLAVHHG